MEPTKLSSGDSVFTVDGREAKYIGYDPDIAMHIVRITCESEDDEVFPGPIEECQKVFATPPRQRKDEKCAVLASKIQEYEVEINRLRRESEEAESTHRQRIDALQKLDKLKRLEKYLDGDFAYFVMIPKYNWESPRVVAASDMLKSDDRYYPKQMKLLALFGDVGRKNLEWKINQYRDGSGDWTTVIPVETEDEGKAIIRDLYTDAVAQWRAKKSGVTIPKDGDNSARAEGWADCPVTVVPEDVATSIREKKIAERQKMLDKAKKDLEQRQSDLNEILAELAGAPRS